MNILTRICRKLVVCSQKKHGKETYIALCWKPFFLDRKIGSAHNSIKWSDKLERIGNDETYAFVYHHSHPFDWGLSQKDILAAYDHPALKEIWAHTLQGSSFGASILDRVGLGKAFDMIYGRNGFEHAQGWHFTPRGYSKEFHEQVVDHATCEILREFGYISYQCHLSRKFRDLLIKNDQHYRHILLILRSDTRYLLSI